MPGQRRDTRFGTVQGAGAGPRRHRDHHHDRPARDQDDSGDHDPAQLLALLTLGHPQPPYQGRHGDHEGEHHHDVARHREGRRDGTGAPNWCRQYNGDIQSEAEDRERQRGPPPPGWQPAVGHQQEDDRVERQAPTRAEEQGHPGRQQPGPGRSDVLAAQHPQAVRPGGHSDCLAGPTDREEPADRMSGIPRHDERADDRRGDRRDLGDRPGEEGLRRQQRETGRGVHGQLDPGAKDGDGAKARGHDALPPHHAPQSAAPPRPREGAQPNLLVWPAPCEEPVTTGVGTTGTERTGPTRWAAGTVGARFCAGFTGGSRRSATGIRMKGIPS
jgi:hypothetical protein